MFAGNNRLSAGDKIFMAVNYAFLALILASVAYPLIFVVSSSFSSPIATKAGRVWLWPVDFSLGGYTTVFKYPRFLRSFLNTVYVTVLGTMINVAFTTMVAWPLSRKDFYGRGIISGLYVFTMFFSGGLIPTFLLIKSLGLYNTYWALILPGAVGVFNMIVARTFFQSNIPIELCEATYLDGGTDLQLILRVVIPLSAPILAVLTMFYAVGYWNTYFSAMIYLKDSNKQTLQVVLRQILILQQDYDIASDFDQKQIQMGLFYTMRYALIVVASVPMLAMYPFIQRHFVKGVMIGALKG